MLGMVAHQLLVKQRHKSLPIVERIQQLEKIICSGKFGDTAV